MASNRAPSERGPYVESGRLYSGSEILVLKSLFEAKNQMELERRAMAERRIDVYRDDWESILREEIHTIFKRKNAVEIVKVCDTSNNPLKRIIDETSTIYDDPPRWKFAEGAPEDTADTWEMIQRQAKARVVMPELNRMTQLCNDSFFYVVPKGKRLTYWVVTPKDMIAWQDPDDPTSPLAVLLRVGMQDTPGQTERWIYWSRHRDTPRWQVLDTQGRVIREGENPYRDPDDPTQPILPGVLYHRRWPTDGLWDSTTGHDLYRVTILMGLMETWVNHLLRTDAVMQKWASGQLDTEAPQPAGGPNTVMQFRSPSGEPVNVGQFSSQANWDGIMKVIARKLENALNNHGLSLADLQLQGSPQSGFSLRVRKEPLLEARKRQIPIFECWDLERYRVTAAVWNTQVDNPVSMIQGSHLPAPSVADPQIKYSTIEIPKTMQEIRTEWDYLLDRMKHGLESPVSIYQRDNPDATEEEALEAIAHNKKLRGLVARAETSARTPEETALAPPPGSQPSLADVLAQRMAKKDAERAKQEGGDDGAEE